MNANNPSKSLIFFTHQSDTGPYTSKIKDGIPVVSTSTICKAVRNSSLLAKHFLDPTEGAPEGAAVGCLVLLVGSTVVPDVGAVVNGARVGSVVVLVGAVVLDVGTFVLDVGAPVMMIVGTSGVGSMVAIAVGASVVISSSPITTKGVVGSAVLLVEFAGDGAAVGAGGVTTLLSLSS